MCAQVTRSSKVVAAAVAALGGVTGAFCGCSISIGGVTGVFCGSSLRRSEALQVRSVAPAAAVTALGSVTGAFCGSRSSSCSVQERYRSVLWPWMQQLQRSGLQERSVALAAAGCSVRRRCRSRPVAPAAAVAAPESVAGALKEAGSGDECPPAPEAPCGNINIDEYIWGCWWDQVLLLPIFRFL